MFNQTVCVFSQIKDKKNISDWIFISSPVSSPRVGLWGAGGHKTSFSEQSHIAYQIKKGRSVNQDALKNVTLEPNW